MKKKVALHNLGCKVNAYELEAVRQLLEAEGCEIVPFEPGADVFIINTCTVTNIADRKSRQMLHRAKKMNPEAVVVACGCYVQTAGETDPAIDLVVGNNHKKDLPRLLAEYFAGKTRGERMDTAAEREYEELSVGRMEGHTRAFIKVQDGCNQFCTYCIIPYARGRVRSRALPKVTEEVRRLADSGCREVVLTGIHLSSYGLDGPSGTPGLLELLRAVHEVEGVQRIRLGSLEPGIITEEFAEALAGMPRICPHFHLSLQSGCDSVLRRMNRRYTSAEYREKCRILRSVYGNPALTTDVIVGFPGETEEEFEASRAFVEEMRFYETHIFRYSRREGTVAAAMPGQLSEAVKAERSRVMLELDARRRREYMEGFLGRECEALMEEQVTIGDRLFWTGYTREYLRTAVESEEPLVNRMIRVVPQKLCGQEYLMP